MNARIAFGKCRGMFGLAGMVISVLGSNAFAQGWVGATPVVVSHGYMTAAVPYTPYGSYGGAGPTTIYRPAVYPSTYSTCPGGNCAISPVYSTGYVNGTSSAACPNGQCYGNNACPNGQCSSSCPSGQCYRTMPGTAVYPANYYSYPAYGVSRPKISSPVYYTMPSGTTIPSSNPVYYSPSNSLPANSFPAGGGFSGTMNSPVFPGGGLGTDFDSPFYP